MQDSGHTYKFYMNNCFFDGVFECGNISKVWGYVGTNAELLCADEI
jgi:hypothetical protein